MRKAIRWALGAMLACPLWAVADYTVVQVAPFSGSQEVTGKLLNQGINLVFKDVNEKGGIGGQKLRLVTYDDAYKPEETVKKLKDAVADKPVALTGLVGTSNMLAAIEAGVFDQLGVPVVGVHTGGTSVRDKKHPLIYHLRASYGAELEKLVHVASTVGINKFGVVYQNDAFGQDGLAQVKKSIAAHNSTLVGASSYDKQTLQMGAAADAMLKGEPGAVILVGNTIPAINFLKAYRDKGGFAPVYTLSVVNEREIVTQLGTQYAHGLGISQVVPLASSGVVPMNREYQALLKKYGPADARPTERSLEGFVYAKVLVEALRKAGAKAGDPAALTKALEGMNLDLGGFSISFAPGQHEGSRYVELTMVNRSGDLVR